VDHIPARSARSVGLGKFYDIEVILPREPPPLAVLLRYCSSSSFTVMAFVTTTALAFRLVYIWSEPFQYHALSKKPFPIPLTGKYAIEKVKPLHGTITLLGHH